MWYPEKTIPTERSCFLTTPLLNCCGLTPASAQHHAATHLLSPSGMRGRTGKNVWELVVSKASILGKVKAECTKQSKAKQGIHVHELS